MTFKEQWPNFINAVREQSPSLAAILSNSAVDNETADSVTIDVYSSFHQSQLEQPKFATLIAKAAQLAGLGEKKIIFTSSKPAILADVTSSAEADEEALEQVMALLC